jgi:hypothetical protein
MPPPTPRFLRRSAAATYIREQWGIPCATRTLAKIACVASDGPELHYVGRIPLYTTQSLDDWAIKKIGPARRSTSDPGKTAAAVSPAGEANQLASGPLTHASAALQPESWSHPGRRRRPRKAAPEARP